MTLSRTELIVNHLRDLANTAGIEASAVVSVDGLIIASALPSNVEEDRVSAMSAAMLSLGERAAMEVGSGSLVRIFVEGDDGYLISTAAGESAVLTIGVRKTVKLGLIFHDLGNAAKAIAELLE